MKSIVKASIFLLLFCVIQPSLGWPVPEEQAVDSTVAEEVYEEGRRLFEGNYYNLSIETFEKFVGLYPGHPRMVEAYYILGLAHIQLERFSGAIEPLRKVAEQYSSAPLSREARRQLARVYLQLGMLQEAIPILEQQAALSESEDVPLRRELYAQIAGLYLIDRQPLKSIDTLLKQNRLAEEDDRLLIADKIRRVIGYHLDEPQLKSLSEQYAGSFPADEALFQMGRTAYEGEEFFRAERHLQQLLDQFPDHLYRQRATALLTAMRQRLKAYRFRIGVLLPMSGPQAPYADRVFKGIQLAMEQAQEMFPEEFVGLVVRDFEGKSASLKKSVEELAVEYGTVALIGPLLSRDLERVAPLARHYRVPLISPTATASRIAQDNPYIFRNAVTHRFRGKALADYAMLEFGLKRFVIFYQNDPYGAEMMRIFTEEVNRLGGEIIAAKAYPPEATDFGPEIREVIEADLSQYGKQMPPVDPKSKRSLEYIPGFDAVFLEGDALRTGLFAAQLAFHDIEDKVLLVTNGGDLSRFLSVGTRFTEGAVFVDGFFAGSTDPTVRDFVSRYQGKYQESPDLFAAQAYDCALMVLLALKSGATSPAQVRDSLAQIQEFHGASGITTFHPSGWTQKRLFVIQVRDGKFVQVN